MMDTGIDNQAQTDSLSKRNKLLEDFVHITSHNLQGPVSNLESLLHAWENSDSDHQRQLIFEKAKKVIYNLSDTLKHLVHELEIRDGRYIHYEYVDFATTLRNTIDVHASQIESSNAIVQFDFGNVKGCFLSRKYAESIFYNLLNNALKYHSEKQPQVYFKSYIMDRMVVLECRDNGLGFDVVKNQSNLFRLQKTFHNHPKAKGVGLYLTKAQVEAMGGWLSVESQINVGSTFKVFLPFRHE